MNFASPNTSISKTAAIAVMGIFAPSYANAWWAMGHLLTARIAYDDLISTNDQYIIEYVEDKLEVLRAFVHSEDQHAFVECATFADFIKNSGFTDLSNWHFIDTPIWDEGFEQPDDWFLEPMNVEWAIGQMRSAIIDPVGTIYGPAQKIQSVDPDLSESFNFRLLIHYFGDIHQPLHSVSRYTADYPNGDMGGNLFTIDPMGPVGDTADNLHALWDSVVSTMIGKDPQQPLDNEDWDYLTETAVDIMQEYSRDYFGNATLSKSISEWTDETYEIAKEYVYADIQDQGAEVSQDYLDSRIPIARQQLAKGGYRLADYLRGIMADIEVQKAAEAYFME